MGGLQRILKKYGAGVKLSLCKRKMLIKLYLFQGLTMSQGLKNVKYDLLTTWLKMIKNNFTEGKCGRIQ